MVAIAHIFRAIIPLLLHFSKLREARRDRELKCILVDLLNKETGDVVQCAAFGAWESMIIICGSKVRDGTQLSIFI